MKSSPDINKQAQRILDSLLNHLHEEHLQKAVDLSIDQAISSFEYPNPKPKTYPDILQILGKCIAHLYTKGLITPQYLNHEQSCAEAIDLLERGYTGVSSKGFATALVDARNESTDDYLYLVDQIVSIMKSEQRNHYIQYILAKHLDSCDWYVKCEMVEILFNQFCPSLYDSLSPSQFVQHIPDLIFMHLQSDQAIDQTLVNSDLKIWKYFVIS